MASAAAPTLNFLVLDFPSAKSAFNFGADFQPFRGPGRATWVVTEETAAAYGEYNFATLLAERGFRINVGTRFVDTKTEALGWLSSTLSNTETNKYSDLLPVLNVAFDVTPEFVLRGGVSRTMTRPSLNSLAPVKAYGNTNLTVTGGNSQLEPLVSDNVDVGVEWYFTEKAVLGVSVFYKDIDSFISNPTTQEPLRPEDRLAVAAVFPTQPQLLDPSLIWTYSTAANTDGTKLDGFEIAYQQSFSGLPGFWGNFGVNANYSYVDAETKVLRSGQQVTVPLQGLSNNSYNATLFYETPVWGSRFSVEQPGRLRDQQPRNQRQRRRGHDRPDPVGHERLPASHRALLADPGRDQSHRREGAVVHHRRRVDEPAARDQLLGPPGLRGRAVESLETPGREQSAADSVSGQSSVRGLLLLLGVGRFGRRRMTGYARTSGFTSARDEKQTQ